MRHKIYPARVYKTNETDYSVMFPDVPGCVSAGGSLEDALLNAKEALEFHFDGLLEDGNPIPAPTTLGIALANQPNLPTDELKNLEGTWPVAVRIPGKSVRLSISMEESLVERIDDVAGSMGRSQFLAEAAAAKLAGPGPHR